MTIAPQPKSEKENSNTQWARLADLILIVARELQIHGYTDPRAISLSQTEGTVMRYLVDHSDVTPSQIAEGAGLQRTNVSSALRELEEKGLVDREVSSEDRRVITVRRTELGERNYSLVSHEWGKAVSAAAGDAGASIDSSVELLEAVAVGFTRNRNAGGQKD